MNLIELDHELEATAANYRSFITDGVAITTATGIIRDLTRAIRKLDPFTVCAIAKARHPMVPMGEALNELAAEVAEDGEELAEFQAEVEDCLKTDKELLAPYIYEAGRRLLEHARRIEDIESQIERGETANTHKRDKLRAAGVSQQHIDAICAPFDPAPLDAEREKLEAEDAVLEAFIRTRDLSLLPPDFEVRPELRTQALTEDELIARELGDEGDE